MGGVSVRRPTFSFPRLNSSFESGPLADGSEPRSRAGLRLRLFVGCLGGLLVAAAGVAWALRSSTSLDGTLDRDAFVFQLGWVGAAAAAVALALAVWLDRGIRSRLLRLSRSVRVVDATPLKDPFGAGGWGELGDLGRTVSVLLTRHRQAMRSVGHYQDLEKQLAELRAAVDQWNVTERWPGVPAPPGVVGEVSQALDRGFRRQVDVAGQNGEAARQIHDELSAAVNDARETAEQAERGFVEGTALLTTIRELQRLGMELPSERGEAQPAVDWLAPVTEAIAELVTASTESVDHLASGLSRVHEISDQVNVLGNRSTLVALNALMAMPRTEAPADPATGELKDLARDARVATDRVRELAREIESQVRAATTRMSGVRERVTARLNTLEPPRLGPSTSDVARQIGRIREMVQDATRKTERLSVAGERASRAADRLARRLEDGVRDVEGMVVRLSPPASEPVRERPRRLTVVETPGEERLDDESGDAGELR
jgi:methyl-accepting chemotaxis protein